MDTKTKRIIASVLGLILAGAGVFILSNFVNNRAEQATAGLQLTEVFVATQDIPIGTSATELQNFVETRQVPLENRVLTAVTDITQLGNQITFERIVAGEQILEGRFTDSDVRLTGGAQGVQVPEDLFEVTFSIAADRAVGGVIQPTENIAIAATATAPAADGLGEETFTRFILRDVFVINVQGGQAPTLTEEGVADTTRSQDIAAGNLFITVGLTPENAQRLIFANEQASLWIVRESTLPIETPDEPISFGNLFGEGVLSEDQVDRLEASDAPDQVAATDTETAEEPADAPADDAEAG